MPVITEASGIQGGEKTSYSSYTVHTFRESGRFITTSAITVDYLLVGGGGSGAIVGGGGGGGGVVIATSQSLSAGIYNVVVGRGGQRAQNPTKSAHFSGENGTDTTFNGKIAKGGGYGGKWLLQEVQAVLAAEAAWEIHLVQPVV